MRRRFRPSLGRLEPKNKDGAGNMSGSDSTAKPTPPTRRARIKPKVGIVANRGTGQVPRKSQPNEAEKSGLQIPSITVTLGKQQDASSSSENDVQPDNVSKRGSNLLDKMAVSFTNKESRKSCEQPLPQIESVIPSADNAVQDKAVTSNNNERPKSNEQLPLGRELMDSIDSNIVESGKQIENNSGTNLNLQDKLAATNKATPPLHEELSLEIELMDNASDGVGPNTSSQGGSKGDMHLQGKFTDSSEAWEVNEQPSSQPELMDTTVESGIFLEHDLISDCSLLEGEASSFTQQNVDTVVCSAPTIPVVTQESESTFAPQPNVDTVIHNAPTIPIVTQGESQQNVDTTCSAATIPVVVQVQPSLPLLMNADGLLDGTETIGQVVDMGHSDNSILQNLVNDLNFHTIQNANDLLQTLLQNMQNMEPETQTETLSSINIPTESFPSSTIVTDSLSYNTVPMESLSSSNIPAGSISSNVIPLESLSYNTIPMESYSSTIIPTESFSSNTVTMESVSPNTTLTELLSPNTIPVESLSYNTIPMQPLPSSTVSTEPHAVPLQSFPSNSTQMESFPSNTVPIPNTCTQSAIVEQHALSDLVDTVSSSQVKSKHGIPTQPSTSSPVTTPKLKTKRRGRKPRQKHHSEDSIKSLPFLEFDMCDIPIASNVVIIDNDSAGSQTPEVDHPILELPVDLIENNETRNAPKQKKTLKSVKERFKARNSGTVKVVVSRKTTSVADDTTVTNLVNTVTESEVSKTNHSQKKTRPNLVPHRGRTKKLEQDKNESQKKSTNDDVEERSESNEVDKNMDHTEHQDNTTVAGDIGVDDQGGSTTQKRPNLVPHRGRKKKLEQDKNESQKKTTNDDVEEMSESNEVDKNRGNTEHQDSVKVTGDIGGEDQHDSTTQKKPNLVPHRGRRKKIDNDKNEQDQNESQNKSNDNVEQMSESNEVDKDRDGSGNQDAVMVTENIGGEDQDNGTARVGLDVPVTEFVEDVSGDIVPELPDPHEHTNLGNENSSGVENASSRPEVADEGVEKEFGRPEVPDEVAGNDKVASSGDVVETEVSQKKNTPVTSRRRKVKPNVTRERRKKSTITDTEARGNSDDNVGKVPDATKDDHNNVEDVETANCERSRASSLTTVPAPSARNLTNNDRMVVPMINLQPVNISANKTSNNKDGQGEKEKSTPLSRRRKIGPNLSQLNVRRKNKRKEPHVEETEKESNSSLSSTNQDPASVESDASNNLEDISMSIPQGQVNQFESIEPLSECPDSSNILASVTTCIADGEVNDEQGSQQMQTVCEETLKDLLAGETSTQPDTPDEAGKTKIQETHKRGRGRPRGSKLKGKTEDAGRPKESQVRKRKSRDTGGQQGSVEGQDVVDGSASQDTLDAGAAQETTTSGKKRKSKAVKPKIPAKRVRKKAASKETSGPTEEQEDTAANSVGDDPSVATQQEENIQSTNKTTKKARGDKSTAKSSKSSTSKTSKVIAADGVLFKKKGKRQSRADKDYEPVNVSKMRISDMAYYNPKTNPMKNIKDQASLISTPTSAQNGESEVVLPDEPTETADNTTETQPSSVLAPQVTIDADGNIVLDEESLMIQSTAPSENVEDREVVFESANQQYKSSMKRKNMERWNKDETINFYKILSQIGTDFSLMAKLFNNRSRTDLKRKFKREEKVNRDLVEKALKQRNPISASLFAESLEETEKELERAMEVQSDENLGQGC